MSSATIPPVVSNSIKVQRLQYETMLCNVPPAVLRKRVAKMLAYMSATHAQLPDDYHDIKDQLVGTANYLLYGIQPPE